MEMRNRFVKYCVLILIFQFINTSFLFSSFSNYSLRRVKDPSSAPWQKLKIPSDYKAGESLAPYGLKPVEVEYKPLLASGSLHITKDVVAALELSVAQALTAFNHKGDGLVSSPMTEANIATVSRKIIDEIARRYGLKVEIAGNEGQVEEGLSAAIKVNNIFNPDGKRDVMLELDGIEGSAFLLSGRENQPPIGEAGYEQGAWSAVSLMDAGNAYCADMYKLTVAYNGKMEDIDPAASPDEIMQKVALGMGYSGDDDPNFKKDVAVLMMNRTRHNELKAELKNMGFDIIPLEHGDCLPLIIADAGLKIDGRKFIVINAGGSHEEYIARAVAKNTPGAVQVSKYATSQLKNAEDLSGWSKFTKMEVDDFKQLDIEGSGLTPQKQSEIQGNPVVILTSITGMREEIFKNLASNFPGIETNPDTGDVTLYSLVSTKEGLFVVRTRYHTDSLETTNRKLLAENTHYPDAAKLNKILSDVENSWEISPGSVQNRLDKLYADLQSSGLTSLASFSDYSPVWLNLYLNTVLKEDELGDYSEVREDVLLMKKIIEVDNFSDLIQDPVLDKYPKIKDLIGSLRYDLLRDNFSFTTNEEKDSILKTIAENIPYQERLVFYAAFRPQLYESYKEAKKREYEQALRILKGQQGLSAGGSSSVKFSPKVEWVDLHRLVPRHHVSTDVGRGSIGYKNRMTEIEQGEMIPLVLIQMQSPGVSGKFFIVEGHKRALAYWNKGVMNVPAYIITIKNPSIEQVENYFKVSESQGLKGVQDIALKPLLLPQTVKTDKMGLSVVGTEEGDAFFTTVGNAFINSIADAVRKKGSANVFVSPGSIGLLVKALRSKDNYVEYIEDWSRVRLFTYIPNGPQEKELKNLIERCRFRGSGEVTIIRDMSKFSQSAEGKSMDVVLNNVSDMVHGDTLYAPGMKVISIVADKQEGRLLQELINSGISGIAKDILDAPQNILISGVNNIRSFLPEDMRPAPEAVMLKDLSATPKGLEAVVSDIESAVNSAKQFGHPALVAVDGWEGAGRGTVIAKIKAELQALHPGYRIGILDIENYYLPKGKIREESSVIIPKAAGESATSDNGIGIRRENDNNITVVTPFDEVTLPLPGIGQEIKVKGHEIYIERVDSETLSIRLSPVIASMELGKFYRDIQNLRQGKAVYTKLSGGGMLEMNPQDYDLIFVRGELTLHQESINSLYDLKLFVDADYSARLERIIRQHIFDGLYSDVKTSDLPEYLKQQRATLEDQFLFPERDRADYTVLNNVYPSNALLGEIYKLDLSQRIDKSIKIAKEEGQTAPWVVLKDYILPVLGLGSNFREVIQKLVDAHEKNIVPFEKNKISLADLEREEISIDILNSSEKKLLSVLLRRIGLLNESS